jgi:hypothetical protein
VSVPSSEMGPPPPTPFPASECAPPPETGGGGGKEDFLREQMSSLHLTSYLVSWTALALGHCPRYVLRFPFGLHHILVFGTSAGKKTLIILTLISDTDLL